MSCSLQPLKTVFMRTCKGCDWYYENEDDFPYGGMYCIFCIETALPGFEEYYVSRVIAAKGQKTPFDVLYAPRTRFDPLFSERGITVHLDEKTTSLAILELQELIDGKEIEPLDCNIDRGHVP